MLILVILLYVLMHFQTIYNLFVLTYWLSAQCQFMSVFVHALQKKVKNKSARKNPKKYSSQKTPGAQRRTGGGPPPAQAPAWRGQGGGRAT